MLTNIGIGLVLFIALVFLLIWSTVVYTDEYKAPGSEKIVNKIVWIGFAGLLYLWITERLIS